MGVLPSFVAGKHAVGLGESSATLKGFQVVPGSYRKGYQDRDNRHIKIGERWLQDYKVSQWSQSDFSGGQYQDVLVDEAMFARCQGMVVGNYGDRKALRTTQTLKQATEKTTGNPLNLTNYAGLGSITDFMWAWDKLFVLSQTAGVIYVFSPDETVGGEGKFMVATISVGTTATCMAANRTIGSIVVGDSEFIKEATRARKMVGGGMRQAGVIAAPGVIALQKMVGRLKEDHQNARKLAEGLNTIPGMNVDMDAVQTNIVLADITGTGWDVDYFVNRACKIGVQVFEFGATKARFVTHYGIDSEDIEEALARLRRLLER